MTASLAEVKTFYGNQAADYEAKIDGELELYQQPARLEWLVGKAQSGPLLDVGCGVGDALELLHKRLGVPADRLHGAEPCDDLRERAQKRNPQATLHSADAASLPYEAETVGGAVCLCVLQHVSRDEGFAAALKEWRRVLQPGAPVLLSLWEGTGTCEWGPIEGNLYTKEEVTEKLTAHGFKIEVGEQVDTDFGMAFLFFQAVRAE